MPEEKDLYLDEQNQYSDDEENGFEPETEIINLSDTSVESIQAELVRMVDSNAQKITSSEVEIRQGGAGSIESDHVIIHQGFAGNIKAEKIEITSGACAIADTGEAFLKDSKVLLMSASKAQAQNTNFGVLLSQQVVGESIRARLIISRQVDGSVEAILDTPRAILAGLTAGIAFGLVFMVSKLLVKRR